MRKFARGTLGEFIISLFFKRYVCFNVTSITKRPARKKGKKSSEIYTVKFLRPSENHDNAGRCKYLRIKYFNAARFAKGRP